MKMSAADIKAYPKFSSYVKKDMPKLMAVNNIVDAMKKFAGTTTKITIKNSLLWNSGPAIKIVKNLICAGSRSYGCYRVWGGSTIEIDESLVKDFELGKDLRKTKWGSLVSVAGVTLLHELTHWADAKDGVDDPVPGDPLNEEGNAFELAVYGKIMVL